MKRILSVLFLFILILLSFGCSQKNQAFDVPVSFYYCTLSEEYETTGSVILPETREGKGYEYDPEGLLAIYFKGPESNTLYNPFPDGVYVDSISIADNIVHITLSPNFARLSGLDLTLACACLSKTIMEHTLANGVTIHALDSLLDGNEFITMTKDSLILDTVLSDKNR